MLTCFDCHTRFEDAEERRNFYQSKPVEAVIDRLRSVLDQTPLEVLASSLLVYSAYDESIAKLFTAYDEFVGILADPSILPNGRTKRDHLDTMNVDQIESDAVAKHAREISHRFRDAISELFLTKDTELGRLTLEYGVF